MRQLAPTRNPKRDACGCPFAAASHVMVTAGHDRDGGRAHAMKYILIDYVQETGWPELPTDDQRRWLGAYRAYVDAMRNAGVLVSGNGLQPTSTATTVRIVEGKTQVLD